MFKLFSTENILTSEHKNSFYLTGLRAYAALAVFFIHAKGFGLRELTSLPSHLFSFINKIVDFGKYGVVIFFVLSAYTISMSLDQKNIDYRRYLAKRLCRIVPMYYLMVVIAFAYGGIPAYFELFKVENSWYNLFSHLSFINLFQVEYQNNLLGVEWSIPIEMFYYLLLPIFFISFKKNKLIFLLIISFIINFVFHKFMIKNFFTHHNELAYHWSIFKYLSCFVTGLCLYQFNKDFKEKIPYLSTKFFIGLMLFLFIFIASGLRHHEEVLALWTAALVLFAQQPSKLRSFLFENKFVLFVGTISYSFYLAHFPIVLFLEKYIANPFLMATTSLIAAIFLSQFTYRYIELPFMNYGKKAFKNN